MIKVSVMYPSTPGAHFDHAYYRDVHMPLVQSLLGVSISSYSIDKGISGLAPGSEPAYVAVGHLYSESVAAFEAGLAPHGEVLTNDISNFTNTTPTYQISEVIK